MFVQFTVFLFYCDMTDLLFTLPLSYDNARESDKMRGEIIKDDRDDNETGKLSQYLV